ncbi:MAG: ATP-binding cassette domain-containing protein [Deltaproteobacteria bacterium]|nr:ATP-binding cassette domain-containing protein [Deltaproteobacteria bacterium]MBW1858583.1 ATP-binding cassette domain-containing protein [Deltaproteobacteria bacterium]
MGNIRSETTSGQENLSGSRKGKEIVLRAEELRKAFGGQVVLNGLSLTLSRGEVVILRGDNGSGKTTLLNILTGNLEPDNGSIFLFTDGIAETFRFPRPWWKNLNPFDHFVPERLAKIGICRSWQHMRLFSSQSLLNNISVATPKQLGENPLWTILRRRSVKREEEHLCKQAKVIMARLGLDGREDSSADMVSFSQAKRVAIARTLQTGAGILFLDEPLAGLDARGVSQVMRLLEELAHDRDMTLVIVEHASNILRVLDLATTVWTLANGELTVESPAKIKAEKRFVLSDSANNWVCQIAGSHPKVEHHRLPGDALLTSVTPTHTESGDILLAVENLVVQRGRRIVIGMKKDGQMEGVSFNLRKGQLTILQAPNGWGKTTLLEALSGLIPVAHGSVKLSGEPIQKVRAWERARRGMSFLQVHNHTFPGLTVREALVLAKADDIPENIKQLLNKQGHMLSGGEKQRVAIACVTGGRDFHIGMFDEPFSALDPVGIEQFCTMLSNQLQHAGLLLAVPKPVDDIHTNDGLMASK